MAPGTICCSKSLLVHSGQKKIFSKYTAQVTTSTDISQRKMLLNSFIETSYRNIDMKDARSIYIAYCHTLLIFFSQLLVVLKLVNNQCQQNLALPLVPTSTILPIAIIQLRP